MADVEYLKNVVNNGNEFLLVSHENPDCDAIGSLLALRHGLVDMGKNVYCYNKSGVPEHLKFLPGTEHIRDHLENPDMLFDAIFILDSADISRVGDDIQDLIQETEVKNFIIIDHHKTNSIKFGNLFIDTMASSTGILIFQILEDLSVNITPDIAKCLYTTIVGDTGSFQYSNTNPEAFRIASRLVEYGANPEEVSIELFESESERKIKLLSYILQTLELHDESIASLYVTKNMYERTGSGRGDTEGAVNFARIIKGVKIAMLFKEEGDANNQLWKVSIRSKYDVDVSDIAQCFGGGGHQKAAGFVVHGTIEEAKRQVVEKCKRVV